MDAEFVAEASRAQELCESRGGRPGLSVPHGLYGLCGRKVEQHWKRKKLKPVLV